MCNFNDQVVIITGGTGNLGSAIAQAFLNGGARLVIPDRAPDRVYERFPELIDSENHLLDGGVDGTRLEDMEQLVNRVMQRFGRIDALVNTVGGYRAGTPLHETPVDDWEAMLNLNARTVFYSCRAVLPAMLEHRRGRIVNIAASSALRGGAGEAIYSASKAAVARLTESMAADYKRAGINVNAVLPAAMVPPDVLEKDPDAGVLTADVANIVLYLCSDAARIIHGALIPAYGTHV